MHARRVLPVTLRKVIECHSLSDTGISTKCFGVAQSLADKKKNVTDEDVLALVSDEVHQPEKLWDLLGLQVRPIC